MTKFEGCKSIVQNPDFELTSLEFLNFAVTVLFNPASEAAGLRADGPGYWLMAGG
jgi:hypothetical protein